MRKISILWIILDLIFLVIFNAVFFLLGGTDHSLSVWISYGFIHFSYLMLINTQFLIRSGKSSSIFGFSIYSVSAVYFLVEFVAGVVFILAFPEDYKAALLTQLIIAGIYGVLLASHMIANEHTANAEEERQNQISYVKESSALLKNMSEFVKDKEVQKKVGMLYDAISSSPVKSHANLAQMENRILQGIKGDLAEAVSSGDSTLIISTASTLLGAVNERNTRLRNMN
jgi:hypothetical protein